MAVKYNEIYLLSSFTCALELHKTQQVKPARLPWVHIHDRSKSVQNALKCSESCTVLHDPTYGVVHNYGT